MLVGVRVDSVDDEQRIDRGLTASPFKWDEEKNPSDSMSSAKRVLD